MARRSSFLDAINAFNQAYDTTTRVAKDYELARAANEKPVESTDLTPEQGAQLEAAANAGQQIGVQYKPDGTFDKYTVNPAVDNAGNEVAGPTQNVAPVTSTTFGGKTSFGKLDANQVDTARRTAQAGILEKYGDLEGGARIRQSLKSQDREDQRFAREQKSWEKQDRQDALEQEYLEGRKKLMSDTPLARAESQYQGEVQAYQSNLAKYQAAASAPGMEARDLAELGPPPQPPRKPVATPGQMLESYAALVDHDAKYGKLSTEGFMAFGKRLQEVQDEGYTKALRLASSGASLDDVAKAFNASGSQKFDPKAVVSDKVVAGPNGVPTRMIAFKGEDGNVHTINTTAELDSLGKAEQIFTRFYQEKGDKRADAHLRLAQAGEGRAAETFKEAAPVRQAQAAEAEIRLEIANTDESTPEGKAQIDRLQSKLAAIKTGIRGVNGLMHDPADVTKAKVLVKQGIYANEAEALDALTNKPDATFKEYLKESLKVNPSADGATKVAEGLMRGHGWERTDRGTWKRINHEADSGSVATPKTKEDFDKLAKGTQYKAPDGTIRIKG